MKMKSKNVSKYLRNNKLNNKKKSDVFIYANWILLDGDKTHLIKLN